MSPESSTQPGLAWLFFALLTVVSWGVYGVFLHTGQVAMGDPVNGRYKAFLFVGIAYFLTAVLAPLALLLAKGAAFTGYTPKGAWWSLILRTHQPRGWWPSIDHLGLRRGRDRRGSHYCHGARKT